VGRGARAYVDSCAKDGLYATSSFDWGWDARETHENLAFLVERFLDAVQDHVAHATRGMAWPSPDPASSRPLPMPVVFVSIPLDSITRES